MKLSKDITPTTLRSSHRVINTGGAELRAGGLHLFFSNDSKRFDAWRKLFTATRAPWWEISWLHVYVYIYIHPSPSVENPHLLPLLFRDFGLHGFDERADPFQETTMLQQTKGGIYTTKRLYYRKWYGVSLIAEAIYLIALIYIYATPSTENHSAFKDLLQNQPLRAVWYPNRLFPSIVAWHRNARPLTGIKKGIRSKLPSI